MKSRTEILVPLAAIQAVPIQVIAWYRLHRYAWYRYSAIVSFHAEDNGEYFTNGIHDIFDAVPNNVLVGDDGNYYFIDTIIFLSDNNGLDTYKKYSPNYSKEKMFP